MNQAKVFDGNIAYNRVSKATARKLYNEGKFIVFCPVKLHPFGEFRSSMMIQNTQEWKDFDHAVTNFEWYNCQLNETGYYAAFYIQQEN